MYSDHTGAFQKDQSNLKSKQGIQAVPLLLELIKTPWRSQVKIPGMVLSLCAMGMGEWLCCLAGTSFWIVTK